MLRGIGLDDTTSRQGLVNALFAMSRACVKVIDLDGRIVRLNEYGRELLELDDAAQVLGAPWTDLWPEASRERVLRALTDALSGQEAALTAQCPTALGTVKWWDVAVTPIRNDHGAVAGVLAISHDISRSVERESALTVQVDEQRAALALLSAQLSDESRRLAELAALKAHDERLSVVGRFTAGVVHDLRNVLSVVSNAAFVLERLVQEPKALSMVGSISRSSRDGATLLNSLLTLSRRDGAQLKVFDLSAQLHELSALLQALVGHAIEVRLEVEPPEAHVLASTSELAAVVMNLAANARDAMPDGGTLTIRLRHCPANQRPAGLQPRDHYQLSIIDTGDGMPQALVDRVMADAFVTTKDAGTGTGMGVAAARRFARDCGGTLEMRSRLGHGTRVDLFMPTTQVAYDSAGSAVVDDARHGGATVLVAEDDADLRLFLVTLLRRLNYVVLEASGEALATAAFMSNVSVDLVITDLHLQEGSGRSLAERLRAIRPGLPVMFLTGSVGQPFPPTEVVFEKPLHPDLLARAVLEMLGRTSTRRATRTPHGSAGAAAADRIEALISSTDMRAHYGRWQKLARSGGVPTLAELELDPDALHPDMYLSDIGADGDSVSHAFLHLGSALDARLKQADGALGGWGRGGGFASPVDAGIQRVRRGQPHFDYARMRREDGTLMLMERLMLPVRHDGFDYALCLGHVVFQDLKETLDAAV